MLIPVTFVLDPTDSIIMLAGIYYGAMYGGTITSVLVNVPARRLPRSPASKVPDGQEG